MVLDLSQNGGAHIKVDDITGIVRTGIITIPKIKLLSDLSMRLGENAIPYVGEFRGVAFPVGSRNNKKIIEIAFLDENIDSDF